MASPRKSQVRNANLDRGLLLGIVSAIILLLANGVISYRGIRDIQESNAEQARVGETAYEVTKLNLLIEQAETGQRGYLIGGSEDFLKPFVHADAKVELQLEKLKSLFADSKEQTERMDELTKVIHHKMDHMRATVKEMKNGNVHAAFALVKSGDGRRDMEEIREIILEVLRAQDREIKKIGLSAQSIKESSLKNLWVSGILSVVVSLVSLTFLSINQRRRIRVEGRLRKSNIRLETQKSLLSRVVKTQQDISLAGLDNENVMSILVERARDLTDAEGAIIELIHGDEVVYHAASGAALPFLGRKMKIEGSFSGVCIEKDEPLLCSDTEEDDRVNRDASRKARVRSVIATPLKSLDKTIGVIKCYSSLPNAFSERDIETLRLMVGFLASAVGKAVEFNEKAKAHAALEQAQDQLMLAKEQAESATRAKSLFLANISHEVRTPLHGILGMARLLQDTELDSVQKEYVIDIYRAGDGLLHIVNDVLDLSKIEAGKLELEEIDFDLKSTMQDLNKTFDLLCRQKKLNFETFLDPKIPSYLKGDPIRLRQILVNLVGNAIKFTSEGFVKVRAEFKSEDQGRISLRFEVEDSGMGMSEGALKLLFTEFMQADLSTTRKFGGTGLGLSICKRMVEQMKGQIGVESKVGEGTLFWFTVSLKQGHREPLPLDNGMELSFKINSRDWKILVADDNPLNQKIAVKSLEKLGLSCDVVEDGKKALDALRERHYDLVLMDCQMPEMDGYQATAEIRKGGLKTESTVPVLAMTASAMKNELERCLAAGMDDYISKPFSLQKLATTLEKWLRVIDQRERNQRTG